VEVFEGSWGLTLSFFLLPASKRNQTVAQKPPHVLDRRFTHAGRAAALRNAMLAYMNDKSGHAECLSGILGTIFQHRRGSREMRGTADVLRTLRNSVPRLKRGAPRAVQRRHNLVSRSSMPMPRYGDARIEGPGARCHHGGLIHLYLLYHLVDAHAGSETTPLADANGRTDPPMPPQLSAPARNPRRPTVMLRIPRDAMLDVLPAAFPVGCGGGSDGRMSARRRQRGWAGADRWYLASAQRVHPAQGRFSLQREPSGRSEG
jgi:hypothetical protein